MKNYSDITENLDITTKQYVDSGFMPKTGGTFTGDVTITSGHLKTDLIKSADDSKWIAEFTAAGLELGGSGYALRFYSSTRPVVANQNKELAYTSDIPDISGKQDIISETNKLSASLVSGLATVATSGSYNDLTDKPTIPAAVTESTVSNWGFTKNTGTVTSVAVKMNGEEKGKVTSSGTIDLGTVITSHQDISGKANLAGNNTFTGGQTITGENGGYSINASGSVKGSWLQSGILGHVSSSTGKVCVFTANGTIYYRTPSEILSDAGGTTLDELTAHINTVATQTTLGHVKMYVEGDTLYLNT